MSGLPPNRSPEAIPTRIENHTASDGSPVEIIDYYQFVMGDYSRRWACRSSPAAASNPPMRRHQGRLSSSTKRWRTGSGKGVTRLGSVCGPISVLRLALAVTLVYGDWSGQDVKQGGVEKETGTELYVSLEQLAMAAPTMNVVLRTILPPAALSRTLERLVREVDPAVPIVRLRDMESAFAESIRRPRLLRSC